MSRPQSASHPFHPLEACFSTYTTDAPHHPLDPETAPGQPPLPQGGPQQLTSQPTTACSRRISRPPDPLDSGHAAGHRQQRQHVTPCSGFQWCNHLQLGQHTSNSTCLPAHTDLHGRRHRPRVESENLEHPAHDSTEPWITLLAIPLTIGWSCSRFH